MLDSTGLSDKYLFQAPAAEASEEATPETGVGWASFDSTGSAGWADFRQNNFTPRHIYSTFYTYFNHLIFGFGSAIT